MASLSISFVAAACTDRPPHISDGMVRYHGVKHGDKAKYKCNTGFKLVGDTYTTCAYGKWQWKNKRAYCEPGTVKSIVLFKRDNRIKWLNSRSLHFTITFQANHLVICIHNCSLPQKKIYTHIQVEYSYCRGTRWQCAIPIIKFMSWQISQ